MKSFKRRFEEKSVFRRLYGSSGASLQMRGPKAEKESESNVGSLIRRMQSTWGQ